MTTYVAFLRHVDNDTKRAFQADDAKTAEKRAQVWLLSHTADFRDSDEYPTDEAWLDVCFEEGWDVDTAALE